MRSFSIGRIQGIDLRVHSTFGLVLLWVIYSFGISNNGGLSTLLYGFVLFLFVFVSVVLHELGHCLMAQEFGIRVQNITLFPFGGAAFIEQMPMRPRSEFMITIAGPAVNVAIAVAMLPLLLLFGVIKSFDSAGDYFRYLDSVAFSGILIYVFFANIMIVLFNLLPAFPMDGGRLVRAGLTTAIGREHATSIAVGFGFTCACAFAIVGIWIGEYGLPLMGIFVVVAAYAEGKAVRLESSMRRLRVGQFALWDSGGISVKAPLTAALRGGPRDLVVTDGGQVVGMLWRQDVLKALNGGAGARSVTDVMEPDVFTVDIDDSVYDVQQQMQKTSRWAVPVVDGGNYRGIFTAERFVHVYSYLNTQTPRRRRVAGWREQLGSAFRGVR